MIETQARHAIRRRRDQTIREFKSTVYVMYPDALGNPNEVSDADIGHFNQLAAEEIWRTGLADYFPVIVTRNASQWEHADTCTALDCYTQDCAPDAIRAALARAWKRYTNGA